jgi:hypothetical protein
VRFAGGGGEEEEEDVGVFGQDSLISALSADNYFEEGGGEGEGEEEEKGEIRRGRRK